MNRLREEYFRWICSHVCDRSCAAQVTYNKLLHYLYEKEFTYTICMDGNRAEDGIDLRYRFGQDTKKSVHDIAARLDTDPCSVLEMMCALALRCEENIITDPDSDNRAEKLFRSMISSLGLADMDDVNFDYKYTDRIINCILQRKFKRNGSGSLFTVPNCRHDMRTTEIWYQMMWYLDAVIYPKRT